MKVATNRERLIELFDNDPRSDTDIAKALDVSKQTVSMWRHGTRSPKKSVLIRICEVFNVSIEWLMGFDVEKDGSRGNKPVIVPDSDGFRKIVEYISPADYVLMMQIFERTYERMKEEGIEI